MAGDYSAQRLLEQIGGLSGIIYSSLPIIAFVPISTRWGLTAAIGVSLGIAGLILVWRLLTRQPIRPALSGFAGVAICVVIARLTGQSKDYFLMGIISSALWACVLTTSIIIRKPLIGYLWCWISGQNSDWKSQRKIVYAYDCATLVWIAVCASRFITQGLLWRSGQTGWLAVARITMGWPLTAIAVGATYLIIKYIQRTSYQTS